MIRSGKNPVLCGLCLVAMATASAFAQEPVSPTVVATVGTEEITGVDIAIAAQLSLDQLQGLNETDRAAFLLQSVIDMKLMAVAAREAGLDADPLFQARLAFQEAQLLQEEYGRKIANDAVTPEALQTAYDAYVADLIDKVERRFNHLLAPNRETADAAVADIRAGKSFADVAAGIPADGTVNRNIDIGYVVREDLAPLLADAAFALAEPGQVTDPIATEYGWQVLQLVEIRPAQPAPLADMSDQLGQQIREEAISKALREDLPSRYTVTVFAPTVQGGPTETLE